MKRTILIFTFLAALAACKKESKVVEPLENTLNEDVASYYEIASISLGGLGAAEITTFDPITKRLFAVNNSTVNKIDVIDISDPSNVRLIHSISMTPYGGYVNSVAVKDGKLAAAIESTTKQSAGKVVVFNTTTYAEVRVIAVGALPDMVTFSPDGNYILTANEGEPNNDYTDDPEGTVSIIKVSDYSVQTINFSAFE